MQIPTGTGGGYFDGGGDSMREPGPGWGQPAARRKHPSLRELGMSSGYRPASDPGRPVRAEAAARVG